MKSRAGVLAVVVLLVGISVGNPGAAAAQARACTAQPTALVLSGGGARGLAHIGVLKVLDSLGVRPDLIVGTSMGAIVGALYASGYRATQIDSIVRSARLVDLFQRYTPRRPQGFASAQPLVTWSRATGGITLAANPTQGAELNAKIAGLTLRGNLLARGDFDRLPIPFRAVATRLNDGSGVVFKSGDLGRAVRASMSIPIVFEPVLVDGARLVDGGLVANVPIAYARAAGAKRVIVSDVTEGLADTVALAGSAPPVRVMSHLVSLLSSQPSDSLGPDDALVRMTLAHYALLDFSDASISALVAEGRRTAAASFASAQCLPRGVHAPRALQLPTTIGAVHVDSADERFGRDVAGMLGLTPGTPLDPTQLRNELLAFPVLTDARSVWVSPTGRGDTVNFRVSVERLHDLVVGLGVAYDYDQAGRIWVGTGGRVPVAGGVTVWSLLVTDRYKQAFALGGSHSTLWPGGILSFGLHGRATHERIRVFDADGIEGAPLETNEILGFAGVEPQLAARWQGALGLEVRTWNEPGRETSGVGARARLQQVDGSGLPLVQIEANVTNAYQRVSATAELHGRLLTTGHLEAIPFGRYGWGESLPLQSTFPLGGAEGFPGLILGERRGSREVLAGMRLQYALGSGLFAEMSGQGGATAGEGGAVPDTTWLWGGRFGFRIDTPVGSLRVAYGVNSLGRGNAFVRVGSWW